jgi:hypothetical protein
VAGVRAIYCVDSSALIHAWRRAYPPKNFLPLWKRFDGLIDEDRLVSSIEVLNELKRKDDELYGWCRVRPQMFRPLDEELQDHVTEIMSAYPRLVDTTKGRSGADPFVIGLARMNRPAWTVLCEENPGKRASPKVPDVCGKEGIRCIHLVDLIQEEDWVFK